MQLKKVFHPRKHRVTKLLTALDSSKVILAPSPLRECLRKMRLIFTPISRLQARESQRLLKSSMARSLMGSSKMASTSSQFRFIKTPQFRSREEINKKFSYSILQKMINLPMSRRSKLNNNYNNYNNNSKFSLSNSIILRKMYNRSPKVISAD